MTENMKRVLQSFCQKAVVVLACSTATANAQDTTQIVRLDEVEVVSSLKEIVSAKQQAASVSSIGQRDLENYHIMSVKDIGANVPNFYIPDYGSRLTSAVYIRGIGSRINNPAVGLYVDDLPYIDKSAFDFNFYDIDRIDILRGPQGTLYGRNTMAGLIKIYTKNPFSYQGTDIKLGYATRDQHRSISAAHYNRLNNKFAFSVSGYYEGGDGFFRNDITDKKTDDIQGGGGRVRAIWLPTTRLKLDFSASYDYSDAGAYPYYFKHQLNTAASSEYADLIGKISNNQEHSYRRGMFNTGLNLKYQFGKFVLNSITAYQNLNDKMFLDQDFIQPDIFTIVQKQKINTVSQEVILKGTVQAGSDFTWHPVTGFYGMYQSLNTNAPVTFKHVGITSLIEDKLNTIFTTVKEQNPKMPRMGIAINDDEFSIYGDMDTPVWNVAAFHRSVVNVRDFEFSLGIRAQREFLKLNYFTGTKIDYTFALQDYGMKYPLLTDLSFLGELKDAYTDILPSFSMKYKFNKHFAYATVSRGSRSGGYNVQMFSDFVQSEMKNQMIDQINEASKGMMERFVDIEKMKTPINVDNVVYKPEYSWNYELGVKLNTSGFNPQSATINLQPLTCDLALFYIDTRDQQLSRFAESGLGRMMVNAGKSRSFGFETSFKLGNVFQFAYGYTNAKFMEYDDGANNYEGNYVPFVPMHTISSAVEIPISLGGNKSHSCIKQFAVGVDWNGAGRIYWTESNNVYQNFYSTFGAHVRLAFTRMGITIWGKNITNTGYDSFYFESLGRGFAQHGKPSQYGIDISLHL